MPCWQAKQGYGSYLSLDFGTPVLKIREFSSDSDKKRHATVIGSYTLVFSTCYWRLEHKENTLIHCESSREDISNALYNLCGESLCKVFVFPESRESQFCFEFGSVIACMPYEELDPDGAPYGCWALLSPSGTLFEYRADGKYSMNGIDWSDPR